MCIVVRSGVAGATGGYPKGVPGVVAAEAIAVDVRRVANAGVTLSSRHVTLFLGSCSFLHDPSGNHLSPAGHRTNSSKETAMKIANRTFVVSGGSVVYLSLWNVLKDGLLIAVHLALARRPWKCY